MANRTIKNLLPRLVILSAGLRNGDAIHNVLFGFAGERETTFEGSVTSLFRRTGWPLLLNSDKKPMCWMNFRPAANILSRLKNDWWTLCLAYVANDNMTISGGYANLGNLANHRESNVWGIQLKYEF